MRQSSISGTFVSLLAILLSSSPQLAAAKPYPRDNFTPQNATLNLQPRQCAVPCGWHDAYCCSAGQQCYTDTNNQAQCGAATAAPVATQAGGSWQYYTTTYVETDLVTVVTTISTYVVPASPTAVTLQVTPTASPSAAVCDQNLNQVQCGSICCASGQFCQYTGQCAAIGGSSPGLPPPAPTTSFMFVQPSSTASAFIRPTSNSIVTVTSTGTATTTVPFQTPVGTDGSAVAGMTVTTNSGLSGGAIAGIVIGVIAAIIILLLICFCCCLKGAVDAVLSLFGLRNNKKKRVTETTYINERHSSRHGGTTHVQGRRWFGTRPAKTSNVQEKKSSGFGGLGWAAAFLATLAVFLGLRRKTNKKDEKSDYGTGSSYSYYSETSETSPQMTEEREIPDGLADNELPHLLFSDIL
ncbi:hypothetical protein MMC25_007891 [Agyrium rufum]|nr:hypothetical protein [Agyrium rufum]